jgi:hypothetical protein
VTNTLLGAGQQPAPRPLETEAVHRLDRIVDRRSETNLSAKTLVPRGQKSALGNVTLGREESDGMGRRPGRDSESRDLVLSLLERGVGPSFNQTVFIDRYLS